MTHPSKPASGLARGYTTALMGAMVLSSTAVFIRYLTETYQLPSVVLAFWRDVFAMLTLVIGLAVFRPALLRVPRSQLPYLAFFGVNFAIFNYFWTLSVALNGASVATVLAYCSPAFSAVLAVWLLKEHMDWVRIGAIVLCLAGCVFVAEAYNADAWNTNLGGILAGLFTGLTYALYTLLGRKTAQRGINPWTSLTYVFGFAALVLLAVNLLFSGVLPGTAAEVSGVIPRMNPAGWGVLLILAAGPTVLGFVLTNISLTYLSPNLTNLILTSEPVFTSITAFFFLGETLGAWQIAGTVLIMGAVIFLRIYEDRKVKPAVQTV
ncbi:MAG: EamA family transporter [Anaerolineaceae bacterium]